jgi:uncharacterized protein YjbI with pentapeptide repeats
MPRTSFALLFCVASGALASAVAADLSVEQVKDRISSATASAQADLSGKDLSDLDLSGIDFRHAKLQGASLFASKLVNCDFRGSDLRSANLNGAWLMGADFSGADLTGASLLSVVVLGGQVKKMPLQQRQRRQDDRHLGADLAGPISATRIGSTSKMGHGADAHHLSATCRAQLRRATSIDH